jgi:hypothetical protein
MLVHLAALLEALVLDPQPLAQAQALVAWQWQQQRP